MSYVIRERQEILIWAAGLSDEELELQTNLATFNTLYSAAEEMAERGFSEKIIRERIKYEKHLREEEKILQILCESRGIETLKGYRKDEYEYSDTIINSLEEKYKGVDLFDMYDKLAESAETKHLVWSIGTIHFPAENATDNDILIAYDKLVTQEHRDAIIKPLEEKYKGINLFDMCDKLAESTETEHLVKSMGTIHSPAENVTGDDILVAYDKAVTKEYRDKVIKPLEEKYKGVDLLDMCDKLSKSKETLHLVNWFGDYALWEPAVNVKKDDILIAYDKVMTSEQQKTSQQNRATHRSR